MKPILAGRRAIGCRFCARPLTPIERVRGDTCDRLDCHRRAVDASGARERRLDLDQRRRAAAGAGAPAAIAEAPVVWLPAHESRTVPLPAARRQAHAEHLRALARSAPTPDDDTPSADPTPDMPVTARVCGFCAGRCCMLGRGQHAFIERKQLVRWLVQHPGGTLDDAAADYLRRVPRRHAENSCVYNGGRGCVLPREMRADICNTYRCEGLRKTQIQVREKPLEGSVLAMPKALAVLRAAWVNDEASLPLPRRPRRK